MNTITKIVGGSIIAMASGAASAAPFYIDNGVNFAVDTVVPTKVNPTSTGVKDEMTLKYQSSTDINFGGDGVLNVGDSATTSGGLAVGNLSENIFTSLNPGQTGPFGNADNGFLTSWNMSFSFTNLTSTVVAFTGGFPLLSFTGGTIDLFYTTDFGVTKTNFMDLIVTGSSLVGGANLSLVGNIDFTNVDNLLFANLFHDAITGNTFYNSWLAGGQTTLSFVLDQNTNPDRSVITTTATGIKITSNHDGSITYAVPEPSSLALLGLCLLGFNRFSRRKA